MNPKSNQEIDRLFQEKLGNHDSALPDGFWERMQVERVSRGRQILRNRALWLLLFVFISMTGYSLLYNSNSINSINSVVEEINPESTVPETQAEFSPIKMAALSPEDNAASEKALPSKKRRMPRKLRQHCLHQKNSSLRIPYMKHKKMRLSEFTQLPVLCWLHKSI